MNMTSKYFGVVSLLVEKHNRMVNGGYEIDDEDMSIMDRVAADFTAASACMEMKRNGGKRFGIFHKNVAIIGGVTNAKV